MNELNDFLGGQSADFNFLVILFNLLFVFGLSLIVSWVYRKTHRGLSFSQCFNFSLVIISLLICAVMMIIGSNIATAFGAIGAFSLIRFRTAIKDPKDTVFVFFAVVIGMAVGTSSYMIALLLTFFVGMVVILLDKVNFGSMKKFNYMISFSVSSEQSPNQEIKNILKKYTKIDSLLNATAREQGKTLDMSYYIYLKDKDLIQSFVADFEDIPGISNVEIVGVKDDIEY